MTQEHANWWDEHVQKTWIDGLPRERADKGWNWPFRIFKVLRLAGNALGQRVVGYVVGVECAFPPYLLPCVMALVVEQYTDLFDHTLQSAFLWYLSPAPDEFFTEGYGRALNVVPERRSLMRIGMDVAITASYNAMHRGRLGLHADRTGGSRLVEFYEGSDSGMHQLRSNHPLPPGLRAMIVPNDGRYFYHDEKSAFRTSCQLDTLRTRGA